MIPTFPQTLCLLAFSRGTQPKVLPPITKRELLRKRWIVPATHEVTDAGLRALVASPHLEKAQRVLDGGDQPITSTGYVSDSKKRRGR